MTAKDILFMSLLLVGTIAPGYCSDCPENRALEYGTYDTFNAATKCVSNEGSLIPNGKSYVYQGSEKNRTFLAELLNLMLQKHELEKIQEANDSAIVTTAVTLLEHIVKDACAYVSRNNHGMQLAS